MKHFISILLTLLVSTGAMAVVAPGEYYIQNDFFNKMLALDDNGGIYLMPYDSGNDANYVFEAVDGGSGYVKLRHKASGKYLAASTSDTWSVQMVDDGDGDQYLWSLDARFSTAIVCKKSTGTRLGCDYTVAANVPIYYDKRQSGLNWFSIVPANGSGYDASRKEHITAAFTNEYGVRERDAYAVSASIEVSSGEDFHIVGPEPFAGGSVSLNGEGAWLVFERVRPSNVLSSHLGNVRINGAAAVDGSNCRVEIWMDGAVVIPTPSGSPFVGRSQSGGTLALEVGNSETLGDFNNEMHSFRLKRGYMVTIATGEKGGGYSRVYVADHADLDITLPKALDRRVSSVYVRNWHYTGKRGYASGNENDNLSCGSSWKWNWDANTNSSRDVEYIPIKQHRYWPGNDNFNKPGSTAMMLINEPEHSEQHNNCSCGGTLDEWTCYTITPQFNSTGLRIGSPSATNLGWIKNYTNHCDNMAQRCDFVCTHGYWSSNWANSINTLWSNSQRPIWITEWEYGSSWDSYQPKNEEEYAKHVLDVLDILEYDNRVERYSYYGVDGGGGTGWMRWLFYEKNPSNGLTQAGRVYKNVKTHLAYDASRQAVPNWWEPSAQAPTIGNVAAMPDGRYTIYINNGNGDGTESITVQAKSGDGAWQDVQTITQRSLFEANDMTIEIDGDMLANGGSVRVTVKTIYGKTMQSEPFDMSLTREYKTYSFDEGEYVTQGIVTYQKDVKPEAPLYNMQPVEGWDIPENGDARASGMMAWGFAGIGGTEYAMPSADSNGSAAGGGIGMVAVWTAKAQYTRKITLPEGEYIIKVPVYNIGVGTDIEKNFVGFIADNGKEYLASRTSYPVGQWTVEAIRFKLDASTSGVLSLGYTAKNVGSGGSPHLAYDYITIMGGPEPTPEPVIHTVAYCDGDEVLQQFDVAVGDAIPAFTPAEKEGYTFVKWSGDTYEVMPDQDLTYVAVYEVNTYTVTYTDGEAVLQQFSVKYGDEIPAYTAAEKDGYTFVRWDGDTYDTMPAKDITFSAVYKQNTVAPTTHTVTYCDGETVLQQIDVAVGDAIPTFAPAEKEGYTFVRWDGDSYDAMPDQDITYVAVYEANTYTVTYYDGETMLQQFAVKYGDAIPDYTYEKEGYDFNGWEGDTYATMPAHDIAFRAITTPTGVSAIVAGSATVSIYTLQGVCLQRNVPAATLKSLPKGMYIVRPTAQPHTALTFRAK